MNKLLQHTLLVAMLSGTIGFVVSKYLDFKNRIYDGFHQIQTEVRKTIYQDELAYVFCSVYRPKSSCGDSCSDVIEEYKLIEKLTANFASIFESLQKMGKFVPYETFEEIAQLNCWQNRLLVQSKRICESKMLINPVKLDNWHTRINTRLEADRRQYHELTYSIKAYASYIFTNKINELYSYKVLNCDDKTLQQSVI